MKSVQLLTLVALLTTYDAHYILYYSDDRQGLNSTYDCLYAYPKDTIEEEMLPHAVDYHIIPYCRRLDQDEEEKNLFNKSYGNIKNIISFAELRRQGVTSLQLLDWSTPIDIAERYEKYNGSSNEVFYNCSSNWFGPICQYQFDSHISYSFDEIVQLTFDLRGGHPPAYDAIIDTCYPFFSDCYRGPWSTCLHWREICDGHFHCLNGEDEQLCGTLEVNECSDNEFRCHYSEECIPLSFLHDGIFSTDCLDGTDEMSMFRMGAFEYATSKNYCYGVPTFQCEECTNRRPLAFSCGDGQFYDLSISHSGHNCMNNRDRKVTAALFTSFKYVLDSKCEQVFRCLLGLYQILPPFQAEEKKNCGTLINHCLSHQWIILPEHPMVYGFFQFVYLTNRSNDDFEKNILPDFICFNASRCPALVSCSIDIGMNNGLTCCQTESLINDTIVLWYYLDSVFKDLNRRCSTIGTEQTCSDPSLFHCPYSLKCISKRRLVDGFNDCYFKEDELYPTYQLNNSGRFICESQPNKSLPMVAVGNGEYNCPDMEDEYNEYDRSISKGRLPFGWLCDGLPNFVSMDILDETDESHCGWWPCINPYTRCDGYLHCPNGADEINCPGSPCSSNELVCIQPQSELNFCISTAHLMERYKDDTLFLCHRRYVYYNNNTISDIDNYFLWNQTKCITVENIMGEQSSLSIIDKDVCLMQAEATNIMHWYVDFSYGNEAHCVFLSQFNAERKQQRSFLPTSRLSFFPPISDNNSIEPIIQSNQSFTVDRTTNVENIWYCTRGILVLVGLNRTKKCLCPPSDSGNRCQWQNQRISLTLQFKSSTSTSIVSVFQIIIMIIDEQKQIAPYHEQITYISEDDCKKKFNFYLLYPHQPKNSSANYSIQIDIFDKVTLTHWASWHLTIPFQFLPVNRISTQLFIPSSPKSESCPLFCGNHGRCIRYTNKNFSYFCQCNQGYSGLQCDIQHPCSCSSDSYCLTSSICICPMNKFSPKCYLNHSVCQSTTNNPCRNNGLCVPTDHRIAINNFKCLCTEEYYGTNCEKKKNRIDVKFDEEMIQTISAVLVHFITAFENAKHERITIFKKIPFGQDTITLHPKQPFHILFIELFNKSYYLIVLREKLIGSEHIQTKVLSNQRCLSINKFLNHTIHSYTYLHRVKYYPLLCRENQELMCFYDENYMCICDADRFSNCFIFDHNITHDCHGKNYCENGGQCFQDNTCVSIPICVCPDCFYGTRCQFSTKGFVSSLDYILGYHVKPNVSFIRQPSIVKMSVAITTVMFIFGLINGILSILTFRIKKLRNVGCGFYLLISSWISILLISMLIIKICLLILSQMNILTNRSLLTFNCILFDMIIKILLATNDWLDGCVSIERVITVRKGTKFNTTKSKQMSKWISLILIIFTIISHLHDPLNRYLIDDIDVDEQRTWCLVKYSSSINIFNSFITFFHFLIPFSINLISTIIIIFSIAHSRSTLQPRLSYKEHLHLQIGQHKHSLIASCVFILLALPRLIISFINGCMKSPNHSWLFLIGYLISFLPSMMTFIVYILPSKTYKDGFNTVIQRTVRRFRSISFLL